MAFNVSTLSNFTLEQGRGLINKAVLGFKTKQLLTKMSIEAGVKSSASINIFESTAPFQAGGCDITPNAETTITQRQISVVPIAVSEKLCPDTLEPKFTQEYVNSGSYHEEMASSEIFQKVIERKIENIELTMETAFWQGDVTSGMVGMLTPLASAGVLNGNPTGITVATGVTSANFISIVEGMYKVAEADVNASAILDKDDLVLICPFDFYSTAVTALRVANLYHYDPNTQVNKNEIFFPILGLRMVFLPGLRGTKRMFLLRESNLVFGTDATDEWQNATVKYNPLGDNFIYLAKFKAGTQIAFPTQVVQFTLVP